MAPNSDNKEEYRFYFNKTESEPEKTNDEIYKLYIIEQNNVLHKENLQLREEVIELKNSLELSEEQDDFNTKRSSNLKGMIKNFHEIDKYRLDYVDISEKIIKEQNKINKQYLKLLKEYAIVFSSVVITLSVFSLIFFSLLTSLYFILFGCGAFFMIYICMKHYPTYNFHNEYILRSNLYKKIDEIMKAQDYIHEFIDSQ